MNHQHLWQPHLWPLTAVLSGVLLTLSGCGGSPQTSSVGPQQYEQVGAEANAELLASAIKMLNELERYNELKVTQVISGPPDEQAPAEKLQQTTVIRFAAPETLDTVIDRLNLWLDGRPADPSDGWQMSRLVETLPAPLRKSISFERLGERKFFQDSSWPGFVLHDGWSLQQSIWLRDAAARHAGEQIDPLERAERLFDWTVRNIQLAAPDEPVVSGGMIPWRELPLMPWHALLLGRGLAEHRLWVFTLLARQQGLDVAVVTLAGAEGEPPREWAAGLLLDKDLYLFEPRLGLPVPSKSARRIATLAEARQDPQVLAQFDLEGAPYPVKPADLAADKVQALIEASPACLARRMRLLENHFAATSRPVLTLDVDALTKRLTDANLGLASVSAWDRPYRVLAEQSRLPKPMAEQFQLLLLPFQGVATLWNARSLHLRGIYGGAEEGRNAHVYYLKVHAPDDVIERARDPQTGQPLSAPQKRLLRVAKGHAAYWLALASYDEGDFAASAKHLRKRVLEVQGEGELQSPWTHGARYNLARSYEGEGRALVAQKKADESRVWFAKAAETLADPADADSPCRQGNLILARQLQALAKP